MNLKTAYRPMKYSEVVGQENAKRILSCESIKGTHSASYIFAGQYGGGKTTLARIHAMAVNCEHPLPNGDPCCECAACRSILDGSNPDVKEIAAAEDNGVSMAKRLSEDISFSPVQSKVKVYILDEAHALSAACWQVLLKVLEEAPEYTMFIMCTTEISKVPLPVRSRSLICNFYKLQMEDIAKYLSHVALAEKRALSADACRVIAKQSEGSMRNALGLLEKLLACTVPDEPVQIETVKEVSGLGNSMTEFRILGTLLKGQEGEFIRELTAYAEGFPLENFLSELLGIAVDAAVIKAGGKVFGWSEYIKEIKSLIQNISLDKLVHLGSTLVPLVSKKETLSSVVMGEMFLTFKEINSLSGPAKEEVGEETSDEVEVSTNFDRVIPVRMEGQPCSEPTHISEPEPTPELMPEPEAIHVSEPEPTPELMPEPVKEAEKNILPKTPRGIEEIESCLREISAADKLFKWMFLPACRISFDGQKLNVSFKRADLHIAQMLRKKLEKEALTSFLNVSVIA